MNHPHFPRVLRLIALTLGVASAALPSARAAFEVQEASIADIHDAILAKKLTATELVKLYLARIKAYNGQPVDYPDGLLGPAVAVPEPKGVNAVITLNLRPAARQAWGFDDRKARSMTDPLDAAPAMPDAFETAARLDAAFAQTGKLTGPLHGVVILVKDQYDTFDLRTTSGGDAHYANDRPPVDADFVARLRAAGAIILGKANMGEYASGIRTAFGGATGNAYDPGRVPGGSSGGSGVATAMSFCTVAIGEESGPSIRAPATYASTVGISHTQELVSRHGLVNQGLNTRTGPVARTVEDAARVLTVIAGYDPKDEMSAFAVGRLPAAPYETFTHERSLRGLRIGVVREYMDRRVFSDPIYTPSIAAVERAIEDLRRLGATIVEGGPDGLFTDTIRRYAPLLLNTSWTKLYPEMFPVDAEGKPVGDHIAKLIELAGDPAKVPGALTMRNLSEATGNSVGESRYGFNLYLQRRGDAKIRNMDDLIAQSDFFQDAYGDDDKRASLSNTNRPRTYETALRLQRRYAVQQIVLAAMAELRLDAVVYPTSLIHPRPILAPRDPSINGIGNYGTWTFIGAQGLPAITVPAGYTTEVYDRMPDPAKPGKYTKEFTGPVPAMLPIGVDFLGRPFSEPLLLKIAAAYEAATQHRRAPPKFGPVPAPAL